MTAPPRAGPDRGVVATTRMVLVVLVLLALGAALYGGFVKSVMDRGDKVVDIDIKSKAARGPVQLAATGVLCLIASGLASFAPVLRGRQLSPLLGIGLALVAPALIGLTAFSVGRTAFALALVVAAPSLLTLIIACLTPPRPRPSLGRFLLRSWMATGFLAGLVLLALLGLELAEKARPRVPWASVLAALAVGTLCQLAARYVAQHGADLDAIAKDHQQVRHVHETDAIRAVAGKLHPFMEEGRAGEEYGTLAADLGAVTKQRVPAAPQLPLGPPTLPPPLAATVAALRAAAFAVPVWVLVPILGHPAAVVAFGLLFPFTRMALGPRKEPSPRWAWLAGAVVMGAGGAWAGSYLRAPGFDRLTWPFAGILALPYLVLFITTLRTRPVPGHLAFLRLERAQAMAAAWKRQAGRGVGLAVASLALPPALWLASLLAGVRIPPVAWPVLLAFVAGGVLWAVAALLVGPAAAPHRARLGAQHAARVQARAAAHRAFLDTLENA